MKMQFEVWSSKHIHGQSTKNDKPYSFIVVAGTYTNMNGKQMAEFIAPREHQEIVTPGMYELEYDIEPNKDRRLSLVISGIVPVIKK